MPQHNIISQTPIKMLPPLISIRILDPLVLEDLLAIVRVIDEAQESGQFVAVEDRVSICFAVVVYYVRGEGVG